MSLITFPSGIYAPSKVEFGLQSNTQSFSSVFTGSTRTVEMPGARWVTTWSWQTLEPEMSAKLEAFRISMRGKANRVMIWNPSRIVPSGTATGTPIVSGGSQTGTTLLTSGWTPSTTVLKIGDHFSVNGELKTVVSDCTSNGSGVSTITFEPPLRESPLNSAAITTSYASFKAMLADDKQSWQVSSPILFDHSISFVEAFV